MDKQISDKIKLFAGAVEKFVENNLMEKHQREENIRKVSSTLDIIMKESLKQGLKVAQQYAAAGAAAAAEFKAAGVSATNGSQAGASRGDSQTAGSGENIPTSTVEVTTPSPVEATKSEFQKIPVQVKKLENFKGELPKYQTFHASGVDVRAQLDQPIEVMPGQRILVPTGLSFAIPAGYEIQARPRSGWAIKDGVSLLNTPGTIDADYRGEVKIILINLGEKTLTINDQDRIAQLVLCPVVQASFVEVNELDSTARGAGGFGSTGR